MDERTKKRLRKHIKGLLSGLTDIESNHAFTMAMSIIDVASKEDISDLSISLPPFMSFRGEQHSPVSELIAAWKLQTFIDDIKAK